MRLTFFPRALSLGMMRYSSVPFQALYLISCMWMLGLTQRRTLWCLSLMVLKMCHSNSEMTLTVLKIMFTTKSFQLKCKISREKNNFSVVEQQFDADVFKVNVITGNDVHLSCVLPSHLADLIVVTAWVDSEGNSFSSDRGPGNFSLPCRPDW